MITCSLLSSCGRYLIDTPVEKAPEKAVTVPDTIKKPEKRDYSFTKIGYTETGIASWYGADFHGKPTASGETFDMNEVCAAHKYLPLGTEVLVEFLELDKSMNVVIRDRGPYVHGRIIDLSKEAAKRIGYLNKGITKVKITVLKLPENIPDFYIVSLKDFTSLDDAVDYQKKVVKQHFPAFIEEKKGGYSVVMGPYTSLDRANQYNNIISDYGFEKGSVKKFTK